MHVVESDGTHLDLHLLIGGHVFSTVEFVAKFVERGLVITIELVNEELFEIGVNLLILSHHLSGALVFLLLFEEFNHVKRLFTLFNIDFFVAI